LNRLGSDLLQFFNPMLFVVQAKLMAIESMIYNLPFGAESKFLDNLIDRIQKQIEFAINFLVQSIPLTMISLGSFLMLSLSVAFLNTCGAITSPASLANSFATSCLNSSLVVSLDISCLNSSIVASLANYYLSHSFVVSLATS